MLSESLPLLCENDFQLLTFEHVIHWAIPFTSELTVSTWIPHRTKTIGSGSPQLHNSEEEEISCQSESLVSHTVPTWFLRNTLAKSLCIPDNPKGEHWNKSCVNYSSFSVSRKTVFLLGWVQGHHSSRMNSVDTSHNSETRPSAALRTRSIHTRPDHKFWMRLILYHTDAWWTGYSGKTSQQSVRFLVFFFWFAFA